MHKGRDGLIINLGLGLLVFVGVSSSLSPWLDHLYSMVALWVFGALVAWVIVWTVRVWLDIDLGRDKEIRESWKHNGKAAQELAEKHAAHPEVAQELAARMAAEREQQEPPLPPAPPLRVVPPPEE